MARQQRFTVYDMLDHKGYFDSNPANPSSRNADGVSLYRGPVEFPKMLYHPKGETKVVNHPEVVVTPFGPKELNERRELVYEIVDNADREGELLAAGWHLHPADAVAAGTGVPRPKTVQQVALDAGAKLTAAEAEIAELKAQLAAMQSPPPGVLAGKLGRASVG